MQPWGAYINHREVWMFIIVLVDSVRILTETVYEKRFCIIRVVTRYDGDGGDQTTNLDKTEFSSKVCMRGLSNQQWPSTQITLFERTRQNAWPDAVTTPLTRSEWILVYLNASLEGYEQPNKTWKKSGTALPDALLMLHFQIFAVDAAQ